MGLAVFTAFLATESQASSSQTETSFLSPENGLVIEDSQAKVKENKSSGYCLFFLSLRNR